METNILFIYLFKPMKPNRVSLKIFEYNISKFNITLYFNDFVIHVSSVHRK